MQPTSVLKLFLLYKLNIVGLAKYLSAYHASTRAFSPYYACSLPGFKNISLFWYMDLKIVNGVSKQYSTQTIQISKPCFLIGWPFQTGLIFSH